MRGDSDRLRDILDAIGAIRRRVGTNRAAFDADELLRVWCLHHITVIGECASRVSPELREHYPGIPWRDIAAMRNAIVHGYFQVDWDEVWVVVERDLEMILGEVERILQVLDSEKSD